MQNYVHQQTVPKAYEKELKDIVERDPLHPVFEQDKELVWRFRCGVLKHELAQFRHDVKNRLHHPLTFKSEWALTHPLTRLYPTNTHRGLYPRTHRALTHPLIPTHELIGLNPPAEGFTHALTGLLPTHRALSHPRGLHPRTHRA